MPSDDGLTPQERARQRAEREAATTAEISEMDDVIYHGGAPKEDPIVEEPVAEKPIVEEPVVEEPIVAEAPIETPVVETPPPEDEYDFDFINEMARAAIVRNSGEVVQPQPQVQPQAQVPVQPQQAPVVQQPAPSANILEGLVTLEEMNEAFNSPEAFLKILNKVANTAHQRAVEESLTRLPKVARQVSMQIADQAEIVRKFYADNPELVQFKDFVRYCATQVEAKHPDKDYEWIANETARLAKSRLPLLRSAKQSAPAARPALPGSGRANRGGRVPTQQLSAMEREIAEMPDGF